MIKPDSQGSSLGVGVATTARQLRQRIADAAALDSFIIAEQQVRGREFTVSLLDRQPLPLLEIVGGGAIYSFDDKYASQRTDYRFDVELCPGVEKSIQRTAVAAAAAIGTRGLARVDIMLDEANQPWVLEVNTIPGLTGRSLAPQAAARAGLGLPELCTWMVRDCLTRETVA